MIPRGPIKDGQPRPFVEGQRKRGDALGDPRAVELTQDLDLLLDVVNLVLGVLEVDDLDGDQVACPLFNSEDKKRVRSVKRTDVRARRMTYPL